MNQHYFTADERKNLVDQTCAIATTPDRDHVIRTIDGMSKSFAANTTQRRTLPAIVCDLAITKQRFSALIARIGSDEPDAEDDALWDELEQRQQTLEAEFKAEFYRVTGVDWALAEGVMA